MGSSNLDSRDFLAAPFDFLPPAGRTVKEVADPLLHQPLSHRRGGTAAGQESESMPPFQLPRRRRQVHSAAHMVHA